MNPKIIEMLRRTSVPASSLGYIYLKDALDICWEDSTYIQALTKRLYPAIAQRENTTPTRVERAIRHATEIAFNKGDPDIYESLFGYSTLNIGHGKPTNGEFIATLIEQLRMENPESKRIALSGADPNEILESLKRGIGNEHLSL
jgi:two-component system response regulator (stage 0 sporulation protein A)